MTPTVENANSETHSGDQAPAPWNLKGRGFMFLFYFDAPKFEKRKNFLPQNIWGPYVGGLGALMLVDYESSDIGPYREILFIPGRFKNGPFKAYSISRIWVSTQSSVDHGRKNWGIPKDLAQFSIERKSPSEEIWKVSRDGIKPFFEASLSFGRLPLPIHTKIVPLPLIQKWEGLTYLTKHHGFGWGRFAKIKELAIDSEIFPDIRNIKPLVGVQIDPFRLHFPRAQMLTIPKSESTENFSRALPIV